MVGCVSHTLTVMGRSTIVTFGPKVRGEGEAVIFVLHIICGSNSKGVFVHAMACPTIFFANHWLSKIFARDSKILATK